MQQPLVSIIIPAYNAKRYLKKSVQSALNQTYPHLEVIVVDDGSIDGTKDVLSFFGKDPRVRYIRQEHLGVAAARNTGIKVSKGEYIAFLDAGDIFLPQKISKQVEFLQSNSDCEVCYSDVGYFFDTQPDTVFHRDYLYPSGNILEQLFERNFLNPLAVVMQKNTIERIGYFDETYHIGEEYAYWVKLAKNGVAFCFLPEVLAYYRVRSEGNLMAFENKPQLLEATAKTLEGVAKRFSGNGHSRTKLLRAIRASILKAAIWNFAFGKRERGYQLLHKARNEYRSMSAYPLLLMGVLPAGLLKWGIARSMIALHRFLIFKGVIRMIDSFFRDEDLIVETSLGYESSKADDIKDGFPRLKFPIEVATEVVLLSKVLESAERQAQDAVSRLKYFAPKMLQEKLEGLLNSNLYVRVTKKKHALDHSIVTLQEKLQAKNIIKKLYHNSSFTDYPKISIFTSITDLDLLPGDGAKVPMGAVGIAFDRDRAALTCLCESMERYSCAVYYQKDFLIAPYRGIKENALNPAEVVSFSEEQRQKGGDAVFNRLRHRIEYDDTSRFRWVKGVSLHTNKRTWVPAQLVYFTYMQPDDEPIIRRPITTGGAGDFSLEGALYAGLCEAIERDAFIIFWLNKLPLPEVDLDAIENEEIQKLYRAYQRYHLEVHVLDMTTDVAVPSMSAIVVDRTGVGPAVGVGAKSDLDPLVAIRKSLEEAFGTLCFGRWLRLERENFYDPYLENENPLLVSQYDPQRVIEDRILLWSRQEMIPKIEFALHGRRKKINQREFMPRNKKDMLQQVLRALENQGIESYYVETTTPQVREVGFRVVHVVVPKLQPLYLDEHFPYLGGERLHNVPTRLGYEKPTAFNRVPHPFG